MSEEQIALARRAVACKGWRWLPGMLALPCSSDRTGVRGVHVRVVHVYEGDGIAVWGDISGVHGSWEEWRWREEGRLPDLQDPATMGCLLALVRETWGDECAGTAYDEFADGWFWKSRVRDGDGGNVCILGRFRHEAEALVAALEAAPKRGEHRREEEER